MFFLRLKTQSKPMAHVRKVHKKNSSTCYSQHLDSGYSGVQEHDAIVCCYSHCQQLQKSRSVHGKMSFPSIGLELYLVDWEHSYVAVWNIDCTCMGFFIAENTVNWSPQNIPTVCITSSWTISHLISFVWEGKTQARYCHGWQWIEKIWWCGQEWAAAATSLVSNNWTFFGANRDIRTSTLSLVIHRVRLKKNLQKSTLTFNAGAGGRGGGNSENHQFWWFLSFTLSFFFPERLHCCYIDFHCSYLYSYCNSSRTLCIKCWDSAFHTEFQHFIERLNKIFLLYGYH